MCRPVTLFGCPLQKLHVSHVLLGLSRQAFMWSCTRCTSLHVGPDRSVTRRGLLLGVRGLTLPLVGRGGLLLGVCGLSLRFGRALPPVTPWTFLNPLWQIPPPYLQIRVRP